MSEQDFSKSGMTQDDFSSITLYDIVNIFLHKWYWFVLSVVVCTTVALLYVMSTPKLYVRTATVLIKDDKTNSGETALFQDLTIFEGKTNVNNEMIVFRSESLMAEAVHRLKLDISYAKQDKLRMLELYTYAPVTVTFMQIEAKQTAAFKAKLLPENEIMLWDFQTQNVKSSQPIIAGLNDTINTPIGQLLIVPTLWYNETWFNVPITISKNNISSIINHYRNGMTVSLADKQTSVVNLSIKDVSIQRAEDVLNMVIAIYNEEAINDKNLMAISTENFINERIIIIENELGLVDSKIQSYKTSQNLTDLKSDAQMALQESSEGDRSLSSLQTQRTMASFIHDYLADPVNNTEMIPANTGLNDLRLESQILSYNQTLIRRNKLIENSSERNPVVRELNNSLNSMRQSIKLAVNNLLVNLDVQIRTVQARNDRLRARISAVPQQQTEVTSFVRQQQIKENVFVYLLNKREENALNKAITESTARVIDPATGSDSPVAPRSMIILAAAFLLGLVIPSVVMYLMMMSDITVRGRKDLTNVLTIPFLGEVPFKKIRTKSKTSQVVVRDGGRDPVSEAFRIIRTNMDFMRVKQPLMQVIMTTSTHIASGKTFIASNLAVSLAMTGKKVLLIDMDIRKGSLTIRQDFSKILNEHEIGLTSFLSNIVDSIESVIIKDNDYENIDIISAGPEPPNPAELLLSPRLDELISRLREIYDYIVIDCVPFGIVADTLIANRVADLTLFIVRTGKLDRRLLPDIEQLYHEEKLKNMALILNGVGTGVNAYGYMYGYGYGYGNYEK